MASFPDRTVNPEDEIFWRKVREAYTEATLRRGSSVAFELGDRRVDIEAGDETCFIVISSIEPKESATTLVVPPGSMTLDPRDSEALEKHINDHKENNQDA